MLELDVCRPAVSTVDALPAVISVHGGSWQRGAKDNSDWRRVCQWLASEGFVAVSIDYRLVPDAVFPSQLDDVQAAIRWLRDPEQAALQGVDPARIGILGGSAGGQLAALAGLSGSGPLDADARVAAVVELSGPVGLTSADLAADGASTWLQGIVAAYLDCPAPGSDEVDDDGCLERRAAATPAAQADPSDPPVLVLHGDAELIPLSQSQRFVDELAAAGVDAELEVLPSTEHSIGLLDGAQRELVAAFLRAALA
nr:alpha/beta hydrolase [Agromyces seonyuensis]